MLTDTKQSPLRAILRSTIMYLIMPFLAVNSFIFGVLIGPFVSYPKRFKLIIGTFCHCTIWLAKNVAGIRYEVEGLEHLPKDDRGYVIMSKHQSSWETLFLQNIFDPNTVVIKKEAAYIPFFGWAISLLNPIFINRKKGEQSLQQIMDQGSERLLSGEDILIFPEGTRVNVGERKAFKKGAALLACTSGSDVIPIALNSGEHWNNIRWRMIPGTIKVVIGPVVSSKNKTWEDVNQEVETWINNKVDKISAYPYIEVNDQETH
jgi:1-acyl-sn-glycerol-3-phosphate acyltransferase